MATDNMPQSKEGYDKDDWQNHYKSGDLGWDLGEVSPPFARLWEEGGLHPCRVLIPGCGRGHEAVFFSEKGFQVTAVDYAEGAVLHLSQIIKDKNLNVRVLHQDFFELEADHNEAYDLVLEQTFFCAIHPCKRSSYVETAHRLLKDGGLLAGLFYETGAEGGPPFNTTRNDIVNHFSSRFEIEHLERAIHSAEQRKDKEWLGLLRK